MKKFVGIDPGKNGSIAILDENGLILKHIKVPLLDGNNDYDIKGICEVFDDDITTISFCVLEKAQAMPGQGVVSMFTIGKGYGIWLACLTTSAIPFVEVHPRVWTKVMLMGTGKGKEKNYLVARQLFPQWNTKYKYEHEWCDSLLLAEYGRRLYAKSI